MYRNLPFDLVNSHDELASGSGFIYHPDGYVLTNFHVIAEFSEIAVYVWKSSRPEPVVYPAKLLGSDAEADLAVLKIDGGPFDYLPIENYATPRAGDTVIALGFPGNDDGKPGSFTVTQGSVSSTYTARSIDLVRHHAETRPGSSGGPVITPDGRVVGISSYLLFSFFSSSEGDNLAVSVKEVADRLQQLEDGTLLTRPVIVTSDIYKYRLALPALWEVIDEHDQGFKAQGPSGTTVTVTLTEELPQGVDLEAWLREQDAEFHGGQPGVDVDVETFPYGLALSSTTYGTRDGDFYSTFRLHFVTSNMAMEIVFTGNLYFRLQEEMLGVISTIFGIGWTRFPSQAQVSSALGVKTTFEQLWTVPSLPYTPGNGSGDDRYFGIYPHSFVSYMALVRLRFARDGDGPVSFRAGWHSALLVLADGAVIHAINPATRSFEVELSDDSEEADAERSMAMENPAFGYAVTALTEEGYTADFVFEIPIGAEIVEVLWQGSAGHHRFKVEQHQQSPAFITPYLPAPAS